MATNPLAMALNNNGSNENRNGRENGDANRVSIPVPRFFEFATGELQDGTELRPGSPFQATVSGFIKAINDDGKLLATITSINGNNPLLEERKEETISVSTQQSNSP